MSTPLGGFNNPFSGLLKMTSVAMEVSQISDLGIGALFSRELCTF